MFETINVGSYITESTEGEEWVINDFYNDDFGPPFLSIDRRAWPRDGKLYVALSNYFVCFKRFINVMNISIYQPPDSGQPVYSQPPGDKIDALFYERAAIMYEIPSFPRISLNDPFKLGIDIIWDEEYYLLYVEAIMNPCR